MPCEYMYIGTVVYIVIRYFSRFWRSNANADINDTSYERQADFHGDETKKKVNF